MDSKIAAALLDALTTAALDAALLGLEHRAHLRADAGDYSFGCRYRLGTASNLVMYVSAADNDYAGVTGTFLGTASQGVWSTARLDFSVPPGGSLFRGSFPNGLYST